VDERPTSTPAEPIEPTRTVRSHRVAATVVWLSITLLVVMVIGGTLVAVLLLGVKGDLDSGRKALADGRRALLDGRSVKASRAFLAAQQRFGTADAQTSGTFGRMATWVPFLGNDADVAAALADAGVHLAAAGLDLSEATAGLPDGLGSLAPTEGRLPLQVYTRLAAPLEDAHQEAQAAADRISKAPGAFLVGPVSDARWDAEQQADEAARILGAAALLTGGLPAFAGADGPTSYLVVPQNPAELRGTGGLWGAFSILSFRSGRPSFSQVRQAAAIPEVPIDAIPDPNPDYRRNYDMFGGAASWGNLNMTPDFPSAARAALGNYEAATGTALTGLVAVDPFTLQAMLRFTGAIGIPGTDLQITPQNVVGLTMNEAYSLFDSPRARKEILGTVARDVFAEFLSAGGKGMARLRALGEAAAGEHLLVYSTDDTVESGLVEAGAAGALAVAHGSDISTVVVNNAGGNKVDYYATRRVSADIELGGDHEAIATVTTTIANEAPTKGLPRYVLGPQVEGASPGDQVSLIATWCHQPCDLASAERDGDPIEVATDSELGVQWYRDYRTIEPGREGSLTVTYRTKGVWEGSDSAGSYRLTFLGQVTSRPTPLTIRITAPAGTNVTWTSRTMAVNGGTATWEGTSSPRLELEIRFSAPTMLRWWRNVTRPLR
jgi:hypothetical protein